jgi:Ricin-type beta-trefoil lectin domain
MKTPRRLATTLLTAIMPTVGVIAAAAERPVRPMDHHRSATRRPPRGSRRVAVGFATALAAAISLMAVNAAPALAANINYPAQEVNDNSNLCMGIAGGSSANGAAVVQFACELHNDQAWKLPWAPGSSINNLTGWTGLVTNFGAANRCLGTLNGGTSNSTKVVSKACNTANTDEIWTTVNATNFGYAGGWVLENGKTGNQRCLGVPGGSTAGSVQLVIYDCNGHPDQVWWRGYEFTTL